VDSDGHDSRYERSVGEEGGAACYAHRAFLPALPYSNTSALFPAFYFRFPPANIPPLQTKGFRDLITIGNQTRPRLFELAIKKPDVLYKKVVEVDERVVVQWHELEAAEGEKLVTGLSGEEVRIIQPLDEAAVTRSLQELFDDGYRAIGICFAHSYTFPEHERRVAAIARGMGFEHVSVSSELQQMIRFVSRANSTVRSSFSSVFHGIIPTDRVLQQSADAYLTPEVRRYLTGFAKGFKGHLQDGACEVSFMKSDGSLVDYRKCVAISPESSSSCSPFSSHRFSGLNAILSGPAGGVVGFAGTSYDTDKRPVVGFDMGYLHSPSPVPLQSSLLTLSSAVVLRPTSLDTEEPTSMSSRLRRLA
jgi:5-oxoprolinase (ATP-hydrolysing)